MTTPSIVLLPGLDGTGEMFAPLLAELPPTVVPIVVRYPTDRALDYDALAALAREVLPSRGPFVLVGESFSGPLAIKLAATHPEGLRALVLVASFHRRPVGPWLARLRPLVHALAFSQPPPAFAVRLLLAGHDAPPATIERFREAVATVRGHVLADRVRRVLDIDVTLELGRIRVPVSYLAASRDALVRREIIDELRPLIPGLEVHAVDCAHLVLQLRPRESARILGEIALRA